MSIEESKKQMNSVDRREQESMIYHHHHKGYLSVTLEPRGPTVAARSSQRRRRRKFKIPKRDFGATRPDHCGSQLIRGHANRWNAVDCRDQVAPGANAIEHGGGLHEAEDEDEGEQEEEGEQRGGAGRDFIFMKNELKNNLEHYMNTRCIDIHTRCTDTHTRCIKSCIFADTTNRS